MAGKKLGMARAAVVMIVGACVAATAPVMTGCEKKGPAEKAGENLDKAAKKTGEAVQDVGKKIEDAAKK